MQHKFLFFLLCSIILHFVSCDKDDLFPEDKIQNISLTAIMPNDESTTRISLDENEKNVALAWEDNDQLHLVFVQGEIKLQKIVTVEDISDDGKKGYFNIELPDDISSGLFDLYGLYGGRGLDDTDPVMARLSPQGITTSLQSVQDNNDVMLTFSVKEIKTTELSRSVKFEHLGSLFSISLKNNSTETLNDVGGVQLISEEYGWALNNHNGALYDLTSGEFSSISSSSNYLFFNAEKSSVPVDESITFWGWVPIPQDVKWPELRMQILDTSDEVMNTTVNSKVSKTASAGKSYHFYATRTDDLLVFTDDSHEPSEYDNYIDRAYQPRVRPGNERVEVSWLLKNRQNLYGYTIYWNNRTSSISGIIPARDNMISGSLNDLTGTDYPSFGEDVVSNLFPDTVAVVIENLPESSYQFEIFLNDKYGNVSEMTTVEGVSYGPIYIESLTQRTLKYAYRESEDVVFEWHVAPPNAIGVEIEYVNTAGQQDMHYTSFEKLNDVVKNVKQETTLTYRTLYLPEPGALDTFYTDMKPITIEVGSIIRYVGPNPSGRATGESEENAADFLDESFWTQVNSDLVRNTVEVKFLPGIYSRALTETHLNLRNLGNPYNKLKLSGNKDVLFSAPTGHPDKYYMIRVIGSQNMVISNFHFTGNGRVSYVLQIISTSNNFPTKNILIEDCTWKDMGGVIYGATGCHNENTSHVTYKNCRFERIGINSSSHMMYHAHQSSYIKVLNCTFEDCKGDYVRFRDRSDFGMVQNSTFVRNFGSPNSPFIAIPVFNNVNPGDEYFATNYSFSDNTFSNKAILNTTNAIYIGHWGYSPSEYNYLLTSQEGNIIQNGTKLQKEDLLKTNFGLVVKKIRISNNNYERVINRVALISETNYGSQSLGWTGTAVITDLPNSSITPFDWEK